MFCEHYELLLSLVYYKHCSNHRLNGSSSPMLTATSFSYGEAKNSTPYRIKTPEPIEIKFGTVDYAVSYTHLTLPTNREV